MIFKFALAVALLALVSARSPWIAEEGTSPWIGAWWWKQKHENCLNMTKTHGAEIKAIFLGDSITDQWANNGAAVWKQHYANRHVFNYGIGGDRTEHILYRIEHGEFEKLNPKVVVLMIGSNNLSEHDKPTDVATGVKAILAGLHQKMPKTHILITSVLPRNTVPLDTAVHQLNSQLAALVDFKLIHYIDLAIHFEYSLAHQKAELFVKDNVHLTAKGYETWQKIMEPSFAKLLE